MLRVRVQVPTRTRTYTRNSGSTWAGIHLCSRPDWHYGVVLLYGQNLAMNHLISSGKMNITKLEVLVDFPTTNEELVDKKVQLHVFHTPNLFSKHAFRDGKYDNIKVPINNTHLVKYYCLNIALDSKRKSLDELEKMALELKKQKY